MKKLLSLILALCLVLSIVQTSFSEEELPEGEPAVTEETVEEIVTADGSAEEPQEEPSVSEDEEPAPEQDQDPARDGDSSLNPEPSAELPAEEQPAQEEKNVNEDSDPQNDENREPEQDVQDVKEDEPALEKEGDDGSANEIPAAAPVAVEDEIVENASPDDPSKLVVTAVDSTSVDLAWNAPGGTVPADAYEVRWSTVEYAVTDEAAINTISDRKMVTTTWTTITELKCGKVYYFYVRACKNNSDGNPEGWSGYIKKSFKTSPGVPTGFYFGLKPDCTKTFIFYWNTVPEAIGYQIFEVKNGAEILVARITNNATTEKEVANIDPSEEMTFRIYSYVLDSGNVDVRSEGYDDWTETYEDLLYAPDDLTAVSSGSNSITLTWKAMEGADHFIVRRNGNGTQILEENWIKLSYKDTKDVEWGMEFSYSVAAVILNAKGESFQTPFSAGVTEMARGFAPKNFAAVNVSNTKNQISWTDVTYSKNGYSLERSEDEMFTTPKVIDVGLLSEYEDSDASLTVGKTYWYRVRAYRGEGANRIYSPYSTVKAVTVRPGMVEITDLENTTYNKQTLTWNTLGTGIKYEVQYSTSSSFADYKSVKQTTLTYVHENCKNGVTYYYRVRGYTESGSAINYGNWSDPVKKLKCAPEKPNITKADLELNANRVDLEWDTDAQANSYVVYSREADQKSWTELATLTPTTGLKQAYTVKNLKVGSSYYFAVSAVRTADGKTAKSEKGESNEVYVDIMNFTPENFTYTVDSRTSVTLKWSKVKGISLYSVTGACVDDPEYELKDLEVSTNSVKITGLKTGYVYIFVVQAKIAGDETVPAQLGPTSAILPVVPTPLAPKNLTAVSDTADYGVKLSWSAAKGADGYVVARSDALDGPYTDVMTIDDGNTLTCTDTWSDAETGNAYYYQVRSWVKPFDMKREGDPCEPVRGTVSIPKISWDDKPESVDVSTIYFSWLDIGADYYEVQRSTSSSSGFKKIAEVPSTDPKEWTDTGLKFGTNYYYRIRGVIDAGTTVYRGPWSTVKSSMPVTPKPASAPVPTPAGGSVRLDWSVVSGATSYAVQYKPIGGDWVSAGTTTKTYKWVTGLDPDTEYYFRVAGRAKNAAGTAVVGQYSDEVLAKTKLEDIDASTLVSVPVSSSSLKLSWAAVRDATSYEVYNDSPEKKLATVKVTEKADNYSVTLTGLGLNTTFTLKVRAVITKNGKTQRSAFKTINAFTAPAKASGFQAAKIKKTYVKLTWTADPNADGFQVRWKKASDSTWTYEPRITGSGEASYTVTGLNPDTKYHFSVMLFAMEGDQERDGQWTSKKTVTTLK